MFHKIKSVKPLENYTLLVYFENEQKKEYDVASLFDEIEVFKTLADVQGLFEQVKVDKGGYGVYWNDFIDLSCNELYSKGKAV
ncbi:MAG: DUF2442 domain-containing protein [Elusimicrobiota bacterium]|jgi:hypothetical protein|nr:DUF2442 domain-containing protein [Elusimicrobiota bacterium]